MCEDEGVYVDVVLCLCVCVNGDMCFGWVRVRVKDMTRRACCVVTTSLFRCD